MHSAEVLAAKRIRSLQRAPRRTATRTCTSPSAGAAEQGRCFGSGTAKAYSIAFLTKEDPETLEKAFERISAALADNEIVCIFPEGKLTTDGKLNMFRPGIEKIIARTPVPVVPMALTGIWGSMFSKSKTKRAGRRLWSRVTLLVEPAIPPAHVTAADLEKRVRRLGQLP